MALDVNQILVTGTIKNLKPPSVSNGYKKRSMLLTVAGAAGAGKDGSIFVNLLGKAVDNCGPLHDGQLVLVGGKLHSSSWKDQSSGEWKNRVAVNADSIVPTGENHPVVAQQQPVAVAQQVAPLPQQLPPGYQQPPVAPAAYPATGYNDDIPF